MKKAAAPFLFLALIFFSLLVPSTPAHAQLVFPGTTPDLALEAVPENPRPNSNITLRIRSVLLDLTQSEITWYVNGTVTSTGIGITETSVATGALGTETRVRVEAIGEAGSAFAVGVFRPTDIDLLWEADSYVPPFYRGRALPSAGSTVRLFAVPRFTRVGSTSFLPSSELMYTWKRNDQTIPKASGFGKDTVQIETSIISSGDVISVEIATADGILEGSASVRLPSVEPSLVLYENHPVFGVLYHRGLQSPASVTESETTFIAVPYFAPTRNPDNGSLIYKWRVGNSSIPSSFTKPSAITINAEGTNGVALIQLAVTHASNFLLNIQNAWAVTLAGTDTSTTVSPFTDPFTSGE